MVKSKGNQVTVQETNDSSILSKASIAEHGYFNDPYLKLFCSKVVRRSPLIQRGYYIRAKAMDYILTSFLQHCRCHQSQIVSLGAGFDASYFRLKSSNLLHSSTYYDIDFPDVIRRKINIIQKQTILIDVIGDFAVQGDTLKSSDYYTLPCDVTDITKLETVLIDNNIDFLLPTLFFSECALTYVEYKESKHLCKWIQNKFANVSVMLYEQINPNDAFGHVMLQHFEKIQSPLKRIHHLDTILKQTSLFNELAYKATVGFDMNLFYDMCIDVEEKSRIEKIEVFDEFEEWHLKCSHYCVVGASQGDCVGYLCNLGDHKTHLKKNSANQLANVTIHPDNLHIPQFQRYGHSCTQLNDNCYLFTGGFGVASQNRHDKLDDGFIIMFSKSHGELKVDSKTLTMDTKIMYHTVTAISDDLIFIFGGRTSPKQPKNEYGLYKINETMIIPHEIHKLDMDLTVALQPTPRWRHAAVRNGDYIYISGGRSVSNVVLDDLWSFRLSTKAWKLEHLSESLVACHTHTLNAWNDILVIYGGISTHMKVLNQLVLVSLQNSIFEKEMVTFEEALPLRYSHTSHIVKDTLYVIGGIDPSCDTQPPILIISLIDRTWKAIHLPECDPVRPLMLHNHCSVLLDDQTVVIVGGGGNCFSFGSYFNPDITLLDISSGT